MSWDNIPGWAAFTDLYTDYLDHHAKDDDVVVEIGVMMGRSLAFFASGAIQRKLRLQMWGVDPWIDAGHYLPAGHPIRDALKPFGGSPYAGFCAYMAQFAPKELEYVQIHKATNLEARKRFADKSCALVLIDGDHSYGGCSADIAAWRSAVKDGGILAGDDYIPDAFPGVVRAVKEAFGEEGAGYTVHGTTWIAGKYVFGKDAMTGMSGLPVKAAVAAPQPPPSTYDGSADGIEREYDLASLPDLASPVVLDIGANEGNFCKIALRRWPGANVHCYEPHPVSFARLRENIVACTATQAAVTFPAKGKVKLYEGVSGRHECSLRDDVRWPHLSQKLDQWVEVDTVDAASLPPCDVLKVDTEGSEVEILSGYKHLAGVKIMLVEVHAVGGDLQGQAESIAGTAQSYGMRLVDTRGTVLRFVRQSGATQAQAQAKQSADHAGGGPDGDWAIVETTGGTWRFGCVIGNEGNALALKPCYELSPSRIFIPVPHPGQGVTITAMDMVFIWGDGDEATVWCASKKSVTRERAGQMLALRLQQQQGA